MEVDREHKEVLHLLSKLSDKEQNLLRDEQYRLNHVHKLARAIDDIRSVFRELVEYEQGYMTTTDASKAEHFKEEKDETISLLNSFIDDALRRLRTVFHNILSPAKIDDIRLLIEKNKKAIKKEGLIELHDYKAMYSTVQQLDVIRTKGVKLGPQIEESIASIVKLMRDVQEELELEKEIISLEETIGDVLDNFRAIILEQKKLLNLMIGHIERLKIDKKTKILDGVNLQREYSNTLAALDETFVAFRDNLIKEKREIFDVLNHFFKRKRDLHRIFERIFEQTFSHDLLGPRDVAKLLSTVYSIDEAFDLMELLLDYFDMFTKPAQAMIKERIKHFKRLAKSTKKDALLASTDPLTGLPNKRAYYDKMEEFRSTPNRTVSMIALDIDYFKAFNEVYGHNNGDVVLREVASEMNRQLRKGRDVLCRYGGEEFVIFLPDTTLENAHKVAEKIRRSIEQMDLPLFKIYNKKYRELFWKKGKLRIVAGHMLYAYDPTKDETEISSRKTPDNVLERLPGLSTYQTAPENTSERAWITISFGVANYPYNVSNIKDLHVIADKAAVAAKTKGRNQVVLAQEKAA